MKMKKIKIKFIQFFRLIKKIRYLTKECKKKDAYIKNLKEKIESYNAEFAKNI